MTGNLLYAFRIFECHLKQRYKGKQLGKKLTNLVKTLKLSLSSCLLWQLSVPFFSTNGMYKVCSFAWTGELSAIFVMNLKQRGSSYPFSPFLVIFGKFWDIFVPSDSFKPYQRIVGKYLGECLVKFICFQSSIHSLYNLWWTMKSTHQVLMINTNYCCILKTLPYRLCNNNIADVAS